MSPPSETKALQTITRLLAGWLGTTRAELAANRHVKSGGTQIDLTARWRRWTLIIEYKASGEAAIVRGAIEQVRRAAAGMGKQTIPVVAVAYMGEVGRRLCEQAGVGWLDLSGNVHIAAEGLIIHVEGRPNRFKRPGRPSSAFAPKGARIARQLLIHSHEHFSQRELAQLAGLGEGYTSRIVRRLEEDNLVVRNDQGAVRVADTALLLDAWSESYDFQKHRITQGHIAARDSDQVVRKTTQLLKAHEARYAATGLAGAWLVTKSATFRLTTLYVDDDALDLLRSEAGLREESRGANVWVVVPNDEGVYQGSKRRSGVWCAHPVQVYLDLLAHPERAAEAAAELRARLLKDDI